VLTACTELRCNKAAVENWLQAGFD